MVRRKLPGLAVTLTLLVLVACPASVAPTLHVESVGQLAVNERWRELQRPGRTSELVRDRGAPSEARIHLSSVPYLSHDAAVQHLARVARGSETPSRYETIDGWPALVRRETRRGARAEVDGPGAPGSKHPANRTAVTVMLAVGSHTVRVEGSVPVGADAHVADEMETIGRSLHTGQAADPAQTARDLELLQRLGNVHPPRAHRPPHPPHKGDPALRHQSNAIIAAGSGLMGVEQEIAASLDGRVVVVANGPQTASSSDGGHTWSALAFPHDVSPATQQGDGSVSRAGSGRFYFSFLSKPDGSSAFFGVTGCAATVARSPDGIKPFEMRGHAVFFSTGPNEGDYTADQPHVAADPHTPAGGQEDKVYEVFRLFSSDASPTCAFGINNAPEPTPSITCSSDGGKTFGFPQDVNDDDHPRVAVGDDGSVYVAVHGSDTLSLCKFSPCDANNATSEQFCVDVAGDEEIDCPEAGLDRCDGDSLVSPTVSSAHDGNADHVFVAWASQLDDGHVGIFVAASTDGGKTWTAPAEVSDSAVDAQRFMPWMCAIDGTAHVGWFDRRAANAGPTDDLTAFFRGSATLDKKTGALAAHQPDIDVSGTSDPQCASAWPCGGADDEDDWESCTVQPKGAAPIDSLSKSCPKYGDYNGIACAPEAPGGGHVFSAWGSGTAPAGVSPVSGPLALFVDGLPCGGKDQFCCKGATPCQSNLVCDAHRTCRDCGHQDEPCCDIGKGNACLDADLVCTSNHVCHCGGTGEPCCSGADKCNAHEPWLRCVGGTCACGGYQQACCGWAGVNGVGGTSGGACNLPTLACSSGGQCLSTCGHDKEPCCNSPKGVVPPTYTMGKGAGYCLDPTVSCTKNGCAFSVKQPGP